MKNNENIETKFIFENTETNTFIFSELMKWCASGIDYDYKLNNKYSNIHVYFFENFVKKQYVISYMREFEYIRQHSEFIRYFTYAFSKFLGINRGELEFKG